jgi:hypothetical protein
VHPGLLGALELREVGLDKGGGIGVVTQGPAQLLATLGIVGAEKLAG